MRQCSRRMRATFLGCCVTARRDGDGKDGTMSDLALVKAMDHVADFRVRFIRENCHSNIDAIALAFAFMAEAQTIFVALNGKTDAAKQFYSAADMLAAPE